MDETIEHQPHVDGDGAPLAPDAVTDADIAAWAMPEPVPEPEPQPAAEPVQEQKARTSSPLAVHHIGIAVRTIDEAMHFYGDKLGLDVVDRMELPDRQLRIAFVQAENVLIELMEATDPNGTVARFVDRRGPGLHHVCFGTPDIEAHLRDLQGKGAELIDEHARPGAHGLVAFLQPDTAHGVLVELLQPSAEPSAPEVGAARVEAPPVSATEVAAAEEPGVAHTETASPGESVVSGAEPASAVGPIVPAAESALDEG